MGAHVALDICPTVAIPYERNDHFDQFQRIKITGAWLRARNVPEYLIHGDGVYRRDTDRVWLTGIKNHVRWPLTEDAAHDDELWRSEQPRHICHLAGKGRMVIEYGPLDWPLTQALQPDTLRRQHTHNERDGD